MRERTCPECGAAFMPKHGSQVCCGDECQTARNKRLRKERDARRTSGPDFLNNVYFHRRLRSEKQAAARRRAEFFAARDAAYAAAGFPEARIEIAGGRVIERRGRCVGGPHPTHIPEYYKHNQQPREVQYT